MSNENEYQERLAKIAKDRERLSEEIVSKLTNDINSARKNGKLVADGAGALNADEKAFLKTGDSPRGETALAASVWSKFQEDMRKRMANGDQDD